MKYNSKDIYFASIAMRGDDGIWFCFPEAFIKTEDNKFINIRNKQKYSVLKEYGNEYSGIVQVYPLMDCMKNPSEKMLSRATIKLYAIKYSLMNNVEVMDYLFYDTDEKDKKMHL